MSSSTGGGSMGSKFGAGNMALDRTQKVHPFGKKGQSHQVIEMLELSVSSDSTEDSEEFDEIADSVMHSDFDIGEGKHMSQGRVSRDPSESRRLATNREAFGTWSRPLDFTLTIIGYIIGIHNFFRFPHMCYRYGPIAFFIPYIILMAVLGVPSIFMECTIGQFYGVGSITAFRQLAPAITGVSYVLAWNSFLNCWMYGVIITWLRAYSGDSLSCLKGWVGCHKEHYYNTPYCWTALLDNCCTDLAGDEFDCPEDTVKDSKSPEKSHLIYYNFRCIHVKDFCLFFDWKYAEHRKCVDNDGVTHSIYERRIHATSEYFFGYVLGVRKAYVNQSREFAKIECKNLPQDPNQPKVDCDNDFEIRKSYLNDELTKKVYSNPEYAKKLWNDDGQKMQIDPDSSSSIQLPTFAFTTCLFITFFLFNNLLSVSAVTYILNGAPFLILAYITVQALSFKHSSYGLNEIISTRGLATLFTNPGIWAEAIIQVLITTGVGNGALISLASFNKPRHKYMFDVIFVTVLNVTTSIMATLICFCTIGHYIQQHSITDSFVNFIRIESTYSSLEFGYVVYSYFLTLIDGQDITTLLYFFMLSSFPTDTAIRLAQNVLDAAVQVLPRLRYHSLMSLIGVSAFYFLTLIPVTRNGGVALFVEYEYFAIRFAIPIIGLIEILSVSWVYTAGRLVDNAEQLGIVSSKYFRVIYIILLQYVNPAIIVLLLVGNLFTMDPDKFRSSQSSDSLLFTTLFGGLFCATPVLLFLLSFLKQLSSLPKSKWTELFVPLGQSRLGRRDRKGIFKYPHPRILEPRSTISPIDIEDKSGEEIDQQNKMPIIQVEDKSYLKPEMHSDSWRVINMQGGIREPQIYYLDSLQVDNNFNAMNIKKDVLGGEEVKGNTNTQGQGQGQQNAEENAQNPKPEEKVSIGSSDLANWKSYIFWNEILAYFEDWPDRLDDSEVESEGSSVESDEDDESHQFQSNTAHHRYYR